MTGRVRIRTQRFLSLKPPNRCFAQNRKKKSPHKKPFFPIPLSIKLCNGGVSHGSRPQTLSLLPPALNSRHHQLRRLHRRRRSLLRPQIPPARDRVHRHPGGVRQGRAQEPQARASPRPGGGQADPVGPARHRPVHGDGRSEQRNRRIDDRIELLREDLEHDQSGVAEAERLGGVASALERVGRCAAAGGRFEYFVAEPEREARCHL